MTRPPDSGPLPLPPPAPPSGHAGPGSSGAARNSDLFTPATPPQASTTSQVATWLTCALALVMFASFVGDASTGVLLAVVLAAANVVCATTSVQTWFRSVSGLVVAVAAMVVVGIGPAIAGTVLPVTVVLAVPVFIAGLDWARVSRLLGPIWFSGLAVIITAAGDEGRGGGGYAAAFCWLGVALATIWSLEQDRRHALDHPAPLGTDEAPSDVGAGDLLKIIGIALAVSLALALLLGNPSCSGRDAANSAPGVIDLMPSGSAGAPPARFTDPGTGLTNPLGQSGWTADPSLGRLEQQGGETVVIGPDGERRVYDVDPQGRSRLGDISENGDTRVFLYDQRQGYYEVIEVDPDGNELHHWYYDIDGRWVEGVPGQAARPSEEYSGTTVVSGTGGGGPVDGGTGSGRRFHIDLPDTDRRLRLPGLSGLGAAGWRTLAIVLALVAVIGGVVWWLLRRRALEIESDRSWALRLLADLEAAGAARGHRREPAETVLGYTAELAATCLPDERIAAVGRILSGALFDRSEVATLTRAWAEAVVDEIVAAHPVRRRPALLGSRAEPEGE